MTNEDNPYGNFLEIIRKEAHADGDAPFFYWNGCAAEPADCKNRRFAD